jgi:hypothetical protein
MEMDESTRQLMLRICDGDMRIPPVLYQLYHYRRRHEIFEWIVKHRITGAQFVAWLQGVHENSPMTLAAFVISKLEHEKKMRPVLIDRDYAPGL